MLYISLLTSFSKLLEKLMYNKVIDFLNVNNVLYEHQYGFRAKHSTIHPIIHLLNHCAHATNKSVPDNTLAILCDLSKAFDVINHNILLKKMNTYGIRGIVNAWFRSYLSERTQFVQIAEYRSTHRKIPCGVPQGSILGPLLFLLYVNDINRSCDSNILSFADDTTLFMSHNDISVLYRDANKHINDLYYWFCANKLALNASKTKYIILRSKYKKTSIEKLTLSINGTQLIRIGDDCEETSAKFLGIYIDEHLTWQKHINHVNRKISRAMFAIKQTKHFLPRHILRNLYFTLIHSHLTYGIIAWGNAGQSIIHKTITLQKRAIRTINSAGYNSHTDPLFSKSNILKFADLYEYQCALFMFDYTHNKLPNSFCSEFPFNRDIQTNRETRQSNLLFIPRSMSNFANKLPLLNFPKLWNKWANTSSHSRTRAQFKRRVKSMLITAYPTRVNCNNAYCKDCH